MSIEQTNVVDIVAVDPKTGDLVLTITDHLEWPIDSADHLFLLQEKLNAYLRFIESGEVFESHPKAAGHNVLISLALKYVPTDHAICFLNSFRTTIEDAGFKFEYSVFG
jgi:hypothetical protein